MKKQQLRQGDVFLQKIAKLPTGLVQKDSVLAYGEITGHNHRFAANAQVTVFQNDAKQQFCEVRSDAVLEHQDHAHLVVPKGVYRVVLQREFDLISGIRQVMD